MTNYTKKINKWIYEEKFTSKNSDTNHLQSMHLSAPHSMMMSKNYKNYVLNMYQLERCNAHMNYQWRWIGNKTYDKKWKQQMHESKRFLLFVPHARILFVFLRICRFLAYYISHHLSIRCEFNRISIFVCFKQYVFFFFVLSVFFFVSVYSFEFWNGVLFMRLKTIWIT